MAVTDAIIRNMKAGDKETVYKGCTIHCSSTGKRSYQNRIRIKGGGVFKEIIGHWPDMTPDEATLITIANAKLCGKGVNPKNQLAESIAAAPKTLADAMPMWERYVRDSIEAAQTNPKKKAPMSADTLKNYLYYTKHFDAIKSMDIEDINEQSLRLVKRSCGKAYSSFKQSMTYIGHVLEWVRLEYGIGDGDVHSNRLKKHHAKISGHVVENFKAFDATDLKPLSNAINGSRSWRAAGVAGMVAHTLCRQIDIRRARKTDFDLQKRIWHKPKTKNGKAYDVPLTDVTVQYVQLLMELSDPDSPYLISGQVKGEMAGKDVAGDILRYHGANEEGTIHGLRSTASSYLNSLQLDDGSKRFDPLLIEYQLDHIAGEEFKRAGGKVRIIYDREEWVDVRRDMMEFWSNFIAAQGISFDCFLNAEKVNKNSKPDEIIEQLRILAESNPDMSQRKIIVALSEQGIKISESTASKYLQKLGLSRETAKARAARLHPIVVRYAAEYPDEGPYQLLNRLNTEGHEISIKGVYAALKKGA